MKKTIMFLGLIAFLLFAIACDSSDSDEVVNQKAPSWAIGAYYLESGIAFVIKEESFEYLDYDQESGQFTYYPDRNTMPFGKTSTSGLTQWDITKASGSVLVLSTHNDNDPHFELTKESETSYKVRQWEAVGKLGDSVSATKVENPIINNPA